MEGKVPRLIGDMMDRERGVRAKEAMPEPLIRRKRRVKVDPRSGEGSALAKSVKPEQVTLSRKGKKRLYWLWPVHFLGDEKIRITQGELDLIDLFIKHRDIGKVCEVANLEPERIRFLFDDDRFMAVLKDKFERHYAKSGYDEGWWWKNMGEIASGSRSEFGGREQLGALQAMGERIVPKPERSTVNVEKPVINITMGALEESLKRRKVIDVEQVDAASGND